MSSLCEETLALSGPRYHTSTRTRRLSARKHQLHRREELPSSTTDIIQNYNYIVHSDAHWTTLPNSCPSISKTGCRQETRAYTSPSFSSANHRRFDLVTAPDGYNSSFQSRSAGELSSFTDSSSPTLPSHHIVPAAENAGLSQQSGSDIAPGMSPHSPASFRGDMTLSPYKLHECQGAFLRPNLSRYAFPGSRTMGAGGRGVCGGGNTSDGDGLGPSGVHPGQEGGEDEHEEVDVDEAAGEG
ncbi:hypothetical protein BG011_000070, partial [Mortierella polycephala]